MTPELDRADRAAAVRGAARAWRRAGVLDDAALAAVAARFPDDRVRAGPVFRLLLFVFTLVAVNAGFGLLGLVTGFEHDKAGVLAALALASGGALAALTEFLIGPRRRRQGGIEAATSLLAAGYLACAAAWWLFEPLQLDFRAGLPVLCLIGAALLAAAAWRWGYPLYAGAAAAALFVALARLPLGRLLWIALPLAAAPRLLRLSASPRLPPAHRSSSAAVLAVALAGLYLAVHVSSWEAQWIEEIGGRHPQAPPHGDFRWWLTVAATALVPAALLALGLRGRRYPLLLLGAGTAAASLVTLRHYVHLAPPWVVLALAGAALVAAVFALRRLLESGPAGERHGFTAAPLFQDLARQRLLEAGAAVAGLAPTARPLDQEPKLAGGGGEFGGGGASGEF